MILVIFFSSDNRLYLQVYPLFQMQGTLKMFSRALWKMFKGILHLLVGSYRTPKLACFMFCLQLFHLFEN